MNVAEPRNMARREARILLVLPGLREDRSAEEFEARVAVLFHAPAAALVPIALKVVISAVDPGVGQRVNLFLEEVGVTLSYLLQLGMRPHRIKAGLGLGAGGAARPKQLHEQLLDTVIQLEEAYHAELGIGAPAPSEADEKQLLAPGMGDARFCDVIKGPCDRQCPDGGAVCRRLTAAE